MEAEVARSRTLECLVRDLARDWKSRAPAYAIAKPNIFYVKRAPRTGPLHALMQSYEPLQGFSLFADVSMFRFAASAVLSYVSVIRLGN